MGSVGQTYQDRPFRSLSKTMWKPCTTQQNEHFDNRPEENITRKVQQETHNTITGMYRSKETQNMILIPGQLIEKGRILVMITQILTMEE